MAYLGQMKFVIQINVKVNSTQAKSFDGETNRLADIAQKTNFLHFTVNVRYFETKKLHKPLIFWQKFFCHKSKAYKVF